MNTEELNALKERAYKIAVEHGFHEDVKPDAYHLGLVMSEMGLVLVWLMTAARGGIERQEASLVVDSISHVCDSLRNGDRYEAGYADGIKSMRKRNVEKGV